MRILITNDDGVRSPGLAALARVAQEHGEVKIFAPDHERSACGHSMTMRDPLRVAETNCCGIPAFEVTGVPVDCINVGLTLGWPDGCDLILSGINNGPNLGFDITYSGTVAGAMEAAVNNIPGVAISMATFVTGAPYHFETGERWLRENWDLIVSAPQKPLTFLNINVPATDYTELRGHRVCAMGKRVYHDRVEFREDPWGRPYYWQGGVVVMTDPPEGTDVRAVRDGFVSITPVTLDWTNHDHMETLTKHCSTKNAS